MKVRCINKGDRTGITENKIYNVIKENNTYFYIINDEHNEVYLYKNKFERIYSIEEIKNGKFAVEIDNKTDFDILKKIFNTTDFFYGKACYCNNRTWTDDNNYLLTNNWTIIKFNQIEFMEQQIISVKDTFYHIRDVNTIYTISEINDSIIKISWEGGSTTYLLSDALAIIKKGHWILIKNENMSNKTVVGYKLIKPEYNEACRKIAGTFSTDYTKEYSFILNSDTHKSFIKAGILDLWFQEILEEEFKEGDIVTDNEGESLYIYSHKTGNGHYLKLGYPNRKVDTYLSFGNKLRLATEEEIKVAQVVIVKMTSTSGDFEIEVSKDKIFYRPDNKKLTKGFIEEIINSFVDIRKVRSPHPYNIVTDTVTVGCKAGTTLESWKKVLNTYNSLQK